MSGSEPRARNQQVCANCPSAGGLKCAACRSEWYCSSKCQKAHWKEHKERCNHLKDGVFVGEGAAADAAAGQPQCAEHWLSHAEQGTPLQQDAFIKKGIKEFGAPDMFAQMINAGASRLIRRALDQHNFSASAPVGDRIDYMTPRPVALALAALAQHRTPPGPGLDCEATARLLIQAAPAAARGFTAACFGLRMSCATVVAGGQAEDGVNKLAALRVLLEEGVPINLHDQAMPKFRDRMSADGQTALHLVAQQGDIDAVELLLTAGADPNARNKLGMTPVHVAVLAQAQSYDAVIRALAAAGADMNAADVGCWRPIDFIGRAHALANTTRCFDTLVSLGADPMPVHLHLETRSGCGYASPDDADGDTESYIHCLAMNGQVKMLNHVLRYCASKGKNVVDFRTKCEFTPLQLAEEANQFQAVQALLAAGADAHAGVEFGMCSHGHWHVDIDVCPVALAIDQRNPEMLTVHLDNLTTRRRAESKPATSSASADRAATSTAAPAADGSGTAPTAAADDLAPLDPEAFISGIEQIIDGLKNGIDDGLIDDEGSAACLKLLEDHLTELHAELGHDAASSAAGALTTSGRRTNKKNRKKKKSTSKRAAGQECSHHH